MGGTWSTTDRTRDRPAAERGDDGPSRRARRWKLVERSFTLAAMLGVIVLSWSAIRGMQRLFRNNSPQPISRKSLTQGETQTVTSSRHSEVHLFNGGGPIPGSGALASITEGGYWEMAEWQWDIGMATVANAEIDKQLDALAGLPMPDRLAPREAEAISRLIETLRLLPVPRLSDGTTHRYQLDDPETRLRVVTRDRDGGETLLGVAAARRIPQTGEWAVFQLRSRPRRGSVRTPHIVSLPPGSNRLCARISDQGVAVLEIVDCPVSLRELAETLAEEAWATRPFPENSPAPTAWLCARRNELVHIWSIPTGDADSHRLAITRVLIENAPQ